MYWNALPRPNPHALNAAVSLHRDGDRNVPDELRVFHIPGRSQFVSLTLAA